MHVLLYYFAKVLHVFIYENMLLLKRKVITKYTLLYVCKPNEYR